MTKICDLSDEQLLQQIEKYKKVLDKLHQEQKARGKVAEETPPQEEAYSLSFDDQEILEMEKESKEVGKGEGAEEEEGVGVTQLISLSQVKKEKLKKS